MGTVHATAAISGAPPGLGTRRWRLFHRLEGHNADDKGLDIEFERRPLDVGEVDDGLLNGPDESTGMAQVDELLATSLMADITTQVAV